MFEGKILSLQRRLELLPAAQGVLSHSPHPWQVRPSGRWRGALTREELLCNCSSIFRMGVISGKPACLSISLRTDGVGWVFVKSSSVPLMHRCIQNKVEKRAGDFCILGRWYKSMCSACFLSETWNGADNSCTLYFSASVCQVPTQSTCSVPPCLRSRRQRALLHTGTSLALTTGDLLRSQPWQNLLPAMQWIFVASFLFFFF